MKLRAQTIEFIAVVTNRTVTVADCCARQARSWELTYVSLRETQSNSARLEAARESLQLLQFVLYAGTIVKWRLQLGAWRRAVTWWQVRLWQRRRWRWWPKGAVRPEVFQPRIARLGQSTLYICRILHIGLMRLRFTKKTHTVSRWSKCTILL